MTTPNQAVIVTLAAESQLQRTGNTKHAQRYHHTRQLIQHVTAGWDRSGGLEVPHAWEAEQ